MKASDITETRLDNKESDLRCLAHDLALRYGMRRRLTNALAAATFGGGLMLALASWLPPTATTWWIGVPAGLLWANGFEYLYHRYLLHRPGAAHARYHLRHHATAGTATQAADVALGGSVSRIAAMYAVNGAPIIAADALLGLGVALPMIAAFTAYLLLVEEMHWRLHVSERLPRWLDGARRRHDLHHHRPQTCFNVFLPIFDRIFGTL